MLLRPNQVLSTAVETDCICFQGMHKLQSLVSASQATSGNGSHQPRPCYLFEPYPGELCYKVKRGQYTTIYLFLFSGIPLHTLAPTLQRNSRLPHKLTFQPRPFFHETFSSFHHHPLVLVSGLWSTQLCQESQV
ncbi:hypothetical protein L6164_033749 [Bauhinia variegata]|uniref:Uncharacterized protein n=1 Tax=Bauhinia variegata TaxID=167791 RepID=A0ACB9KTJ2_BAUVA|nr:hypothetical protein L6164_033749 [Bauhinia variegata]